MPPGGSILSATDMDAGGREALVGVRDRIAAELTAAPHGGDLKLERYAAPPGDPGLFGITPADPVWRVHGQATGMLTGGFAALMLQSLHPLAMAGVGQYSDSAPIRSGG